MPVVEELRRLGHDALTIQESGKGNQAVPDEEVLAFAVSENRAVLTLNRKHFVRLHNAQPDHSGIIVCTVDADFTGQASRIHLAIESQQTLDGQLVRVNRPMK
ncbi:MAG TPA: DUF5615 family PIN-like protein [Blastocatellia bacterium]|nr:DUF5615 family PIN-like protein [Blastocatellia bacterium]